MKQNKDTENNKKKVMGTKSLMQGISSGMVEVLGPNRAKRVKSVQGHNHDDEDQHLQVDDDDSMDNDSVIVFFQ